MQLIGHDTSRVILLTQVHRPAGQAYLPEAAAKLLQRYSFAKYPSLDDLQKDTVIFSIGKFKDVQIAELGIYNDGIIVAARCNTNLLDEFIEDLFSWMGSEVGLVPVPSFKPEKHYESLVLVQTTTDIGSVLSPQREAVNVIASALREGTGVNFQTSGTIYDCDPEPLRLVRKPNRFMIERRLGRPFSENLFYCAAPLKTDSHLVLLSSLEGLASG